MVTDTKTEKEYKIKRKQKIYVKLAKKKREVQTSVMAFGEDTIIQLKKLGFVSINEIERIKFKPAGFRRTLKTTGYVVAGAWGVYVLSEFLVTTNSLNLGFGAAGVILIGLITEGSCLLVGSLQNEVKISKEHLELEIN